MTIAGSDNSGGAGLEADLKTFTTLGVYGVCAVTCIVAEHPGKVKSIQTVKQGMIVDQVALNFEAFPVDAMKTGMLYSKYIIKALADALAKIKNRPWLVVDPVMVATSGRRLLRADAIRSLTEILFPMADLITPNLDEAAILLGKQVSSVEGMCEAAAALAQKYGCAVLVKGGHLGGENACDALAIKRDVTLFNAPFKKNIHTHGTGCTLSAAITASLAKGSTISGAVADGKAFVSAAIGRSFRLGKFDVLNHLP